MSNNKQSSVEWLKNNLPSLFEHDDNGFYKNLFQQAKAMHKDEVESAYMSGAYDKATVFEEATNYYNETFGGGE